MRELKPLHLPQLVATRNRSVSPEEEVVPKTGITIHSMTSSYCTSDSSTPPTPTFSLRGHSRFPSSSSSLASSATSPIYEQADVAISSSKLPMPKLAEEPTEQDEQYGGFQDSFDSYDLGSGDEGDRSVRTTVVLRDSHYYDLDSDFFGDEHDAVLSRALKRQKSNELLLNTFSFSARLGERFPSLTKRWNQRKPAKVVTGLGIQSVHSSRPASSRSSSLTSAHFQGFDQNDEIPTTPAMSYAEDISTPVSPIDIPRPMESEPVNRKTFASTPLLPPLMNGPVEEEEEVQSPLQSPTTADPDKTFSIVSIGSLVSSPQTQGYSALPSPSLSTKPSISSFHRMRTSTMTSYAPAAELPPLFIADPTDEWSIKLGHANFSISPKPYLPEVFNLQTCRQLFYDWELARANYFRHKHRTVEHYGGNSKTFKLTEEKWAEIDAQWRKNNEYATLQSGHGSTDSVPTTPTEPLSLTSVPTLNDPRSPGKFPKLGDQDIVGQMVQVARQPQQQGKITTFFKTMFGGARIRSATR